MKPDRLANWLKTAPLWALLLVFSLFASLPHGAMPQAGPQGLTMVLCTGTGTVEVSIGPDGVPRPVRSAAPDCPWTVLGATGPLIAPASVPVLFASARPFRTVAAVRLFRDAGGPVPYQSRAPPDLL